MHRHATDCASLDEVRRQIDRIDADLVRLIALRGTYVRRAAALKRSPAEVPDPARVARVLDRVRALAVDAGAEPAVVEATWRAMVGAFIDAEQRLQARLHAQPAPGG